MYMYTSYVCIYDSNYTSTPRSMINVPPTPPTAALGHREMFLLTIFTHSPIHLRDQCATQPSDPSYWTQIMPS